MSTPVIFYDTRRDLPVWAWQAVRAASSHGPTVLFKPPSKNDLSDTRLHIIDPMDVHGAGDALLRFRHSYRHMSTAPVAYERACFERFLVLDAYMENTSLSHVWHMDTDAVAQAAVRHIGPRLARDGWDAVTSGSREYARLGDAISAGNSFLSHAAVRAFADLIGGSFYNELLPQVEQWWHQRLADGHSGGVCDMTAWGLCLSTRQDLRTLDSNWQDIDGYLIINSWYGLRDQWARVEGYQPRRLFVESGGSSIFDPDTGRRAPVAAIHFSGADKWMVHRTLRRRRVLLNGLEHRAWRSGYRVQRRMSKHLSSP